MSETPANAIKLTFPSLSKLVEYAQSPCKAEDEKRSSLTSDQDRFGGRSWYGTESLPDACKLALDGWEGPRVEVNRYVDEVRDHVQRFTLPSFVPTFDVSGGEVDVDRYLLGEPENMIEQTIMPTAKHGKVVRLIVAGTVSAMIDQDTINKRGAAIVALIDALRIAQHTLEIWVQHGVETYAAGQHKEWHCVTLLKAPEDQVDLDSLMFALAHPSMLRRLIFSVMEHESALVRRQFHFHSGGGYGQCMSKVPEWIHADDDRPFDVVVDSKALDNIDRSPEDWLDGVLKGLEIIGDA